MLGLDACVNELCWRGARRVSCSMTKHTLLRTVQCSAMRTARRGAAVCAASDTYPEAPRAAAAERLARGDAGHRVGAVGVLAESLGENI